MTTHLTIRETMWLIGIATPIIISLFIGVYVFLVRKYIDSLEFKAKDEASKVMVEVNHFRQEYEKYSIVIEKKLEELCRIVNDIRTAQAACQSSLPEKYVPRQSCDRDMSEIKGIIRHNSYYQGIQ